MGVVVTARGSWTDTFDHAEGHAYHTLAVDDVQAMDLEARL